MEVILLERIEKLGEMGEIVNVKPGFARNYLLPQSKALRATSANKESFEARRAELEDANAKRRTDALGAAGNVDGASVVLVRQASDSGQLYGSVRPRDIANALKETGAEIDRSQVRQDAPIKLLGLHNVRIALHPEVIAVVTVNVARSDEEALLQAQGVSVIDAERAALNDDTGEPDDETAEAADAAEAGAGTTDDAGDGEDAGDSTGDGAGAETAESAAEEDKAEDNKDAPTA
jgi:large subunit ribosomal protein L9